MTLITIDRRPFDVNAEQNLLEVCLSHGLNLPYFCWHPALGSVGACRQCAVKLFRNEADTAGRVVMACMTPVSKGMLVSVEDPEVRQFRAAVIEGLMTSHPHDCPVCDEGGECHLQDMTVMTGHDYRCYNFKKRTFVNQNLGPLVNHEMNRCIQCYRCVRFYREYAGGKDLHAFGLRNTVYFGREEDGVLENEFSGNLVEVCPTGVFTDKTLKRHYTRKWDLQMAPSLCVHCALGCNVSAGERYGTLRRILNRYNNQVNGYFLCDRGRFGYEFVNSQRRIRQPLLRGDGKVESVPKSAALEQVAGRLARRERVIGIGSPRASLEANFVLRSLVGPERFFAGVEDGTSHLVRAMLDILRAGPARTPSLHEIELSDAVLILGEDVTSVAPRMALCLRQSVLQQPLEIVEKMHIPLWQDHAVREAIQDAKGPFFIASPYTTRLDDVATETYRASPEDVARLGFAVANLLDAGAPGVPGLSRETQALAERIAQALKSARKRLVVSGASCHSETVIQAAANVARALSSGDRVAALSFTMPECNSFGLACLRGGELSAAFQAVREGSADAVIMLENDLYRRAPAATVDAFFDAAKYVIALDHLENRTTAKAHLVLPVATFAESEGTLVSSEGRAQRFYKAFVPQGEIQDSWRWLRDAMVAAGRREAAAWQNLDDVIATVAAAPGLAGIKDAAPSARFRAVGAKIPREPHRYSGRTAMLANISVHEPKPPDDADAPLSFSMEGYAIEEYPKESRPAPPPSPLIPFFWAPGWNSIQSVNKFQEEIPGPLRGGDPGVRLIEPPQARNGSYFANVPPAFEPRDAEWLLISREHIFGSEELSAHAPGIAELAPSPYVAMNPEDAERAGIRAGEEVDVKLNGTAQRLRVLFEPSLPRGLAAVPGGMSPLDGVALPTWSRISRLR